jgi:Flavin containing amine oxidoreductase
VVLATPFTSLREVDLERAGLSPRKRECIRELGMGTNATTRYSRAIAREEGGVHFAGEHTSVAYRGFLEGAVESGERCAREVLRAPG